MSQVEDQAFLRAVVRGRVQGVGFRWWVYQLAVELDLVGRVRNRRDGTVLVKAEGARNQLEDLAKALHRGPRHARVIGVRVDWSTPSNEWNRFAIDHT